jgi:hypothetical protein
VPFIEYCECKVCGRRRQLNSTGGPFGIRRGKLVIENEKCKCVILWMLIFVSRTFLSSP